MLNFCLPENILEELVLQLEKKREKLEIELNQINILITKILGLQQVNLIKNNEITLPQDNNKKK